MIVTSSHPATQARRTVPTGRASRVEAVVPSANDTQASKRQLALVPVDAGHDPSSPSSQRSSHLSQTPAEVTRAAVYLQALSGHRPRGLRAEISERARYRAAYEQAARPMRACLPTMVKVA